MIEFKDLSFSYSNKPVIKNISAQFKSGRLYGVIGPNGCGKSTLLKLLSGLLDSQSGCITVDGIHLNNIPRKELAKRIAIMPQIRPLPDMTVLDYILCARFPFRNDKDNSALKDREAAINALKLTNTGIFAQRKLCELSGGERQRVYLAFLIAQNTDIVLCDEPATFLDIKGNIDVMNTLLNMKNTGKCVIAVLHDLTSALRFCDEIILMKNGEIADMGIPEQIVKNKSIDEIFGVVCKPIATESGTNYIFE